MKRHKISLYGYTLAICLMIAGCSAQESRSGPADVAGSFVQNDVVAEGAKGSIKGTIKLEGTAPKMKPIRMGADPVCAAAHSKPVVSDAVLVSADGGLKNVIVFLKEGVTGKFTAPTTSVVMNQQGCQYVPHVFGLMDGQKLEIKNSDKTLHNVHCYEGIATCFNRAMFQGMAPITHVFKDKQEDVFVKFKCDVHPWMTAYALVSKNPFFAITTADGTFEIKDVPPGEYTIKTWHEKYGDQTQKITVKAGEAAAANASYKAGA